MPAKPLNDAQIGGRFLFKPMKERYSKPVLSFEAQAELLKSRGVIIADEELAVKFLSNVNYYRLSAYMYPFLEEKPAHIFKQGTEFQQIIDLYTFDEELRALIFSSIAAIEISTKTTILYTLAFHHGAFWINEPTVFFNQGKHTLQLAKLTDELKRSDEEFLRHFYNKYSDSIPPVWMCFEIASFGFISQVFQNLKERKIQKEAASKYNLPSAVFLSWLHTLVYVRNITAHHARLWNRRLGVIPVLPKTPIVGWLNNPVQDNRRLYVVICIIAYLLSIIAPQNNFIVRIKGLLKKFPRIDTAAMGFPKGWENEPIFSRETE